MDEILMLQDEIGELQTCFSEELADNDGEGEAGDQLALQSTLTVLGERMATIRMKASGKRQLLEVDTIRSPCFPCIFFFKLTPPYLVSSLIPVNLFVMSTTTGETK